MCVEGSDFSDSIFPDEKNRIWLEMRHQVPVVKRIQEYERVKLGGLFSECSEKETEERLDSLDLSYLDPLTGIQGQEYFLRNKKDFENRGIIIALKGETIDYINRKLGYKYGNLVMYAMSRLIKSRCSGFMRLAFCGRKFIVLDKDISLLNSIHFLLSRTCLRTTDGYEMKGIGIEFFPVEEKYLENDKSEGLNPGLKNYPFGTKIYRIAMLSDSIDWCDIYEYGRFVHRLEGKILEHILSIGV
jgi:GGDEF domain-containing protein